MRTRIMPEDFETTALEDCGHAGQPGYVFRQGDKVLVTPAGNLPLGGFFVSKVNGEDSINLQAKELHKFVVVPWLVQAS